MQRRLAEFDVLRGLAAVAVMLCHYPGEYLTREAHWNPAYLPIPFAYGPYGVQFFFMLSGFVIFFSLKKTTSPKDFIVSRFSRLYPAYWCAIALSVAVGAGIGLPGWDFSVMEILANTTMFHRFLLIPSLEPPHWYLTFELMFYGIMLILLICRLTERMDVICGLWLLFQISAWAAQDYCGLHLTDRLKGAFLLEFANLFIAGMLFYRVKVEGASLYRYLLLGCCLALQWILFGRVSGTIVTIYFLLFILIINGRLSFIICRPLLFLGSISYSIYLIHHNLGLVVIQTLYHHGLNLTLSIFAAVIVVIILASLISIHVEKPAMIAIRNLFTKIDGLAKRSCNTKTTL